VTDYHQWPDNANGFVFEHFTAEACVDALKRAVRVYHDQDAWTALQSRGMKTDFSWEASAREYVKMYRRARDLHRQNQ
jgi:starch synthase